MSADPSSDTNFQEIWTEAIRTYQEQTSRDLQNDSILQKIRSTEVLLDEINSRNKTFENFRNHHRRLWTALSSCLKPLDLLGKTLQSAVSSAPFAPAIFAGVLHLVTACSAVSDSYDYLGKLFSELEDYTVRLQEYLKGGMDASLKKKSVATLSFLLKIVGLSEKMIKTGRFRQFLSGAVFGGEEMKSALERLKDQIDSEERLVIAVTYSSSQRTEHKVEGLTRSVEEMRALQKSTRDEERKAAEDKTIRNLLDSSAIVKIRDIYSEMKDSIVDGSGKWIQDEPLFNTWIERKAPILWIFGKPGTGKSFLATRIILDLLTRYPQDVRHPSRISVGYFYVKEDDQHLHDLNTILKSIAFQITHVDPIYKKHVLNIDSSDGSVQSARSTWEYLFMNFFGSKSNFDHSAFIIIDGLDEAPDETRKILFGLLRSIVHPTSATTRPRIQFAILGRPELREDFQFSMKEKSIDISPQKNHGDIAKYIQENVKKVSILRRMQRPAAKKFAKEIYDTVLKGSDGMFLWAKLVLAQIYEKERKSELLEALNSAPRELDGMIQRVFERLERDVDINHQDLNKILAWVTCARRPLLLGELDVILRMPSGEANLALRDRLRGKFASILNLARIGGDEGINEEPAFAETEKAPNMDYLFLDDSDDSTTVDDEVSDDESKNTTRNADSLPPDIQLQREFETTQVVFGHKRIKDYIVQSNFRFSPSDPLAIGVEVNKSEVEMTTVLLSIICDGITKIHNQFDLASYAAENFVKHLEAIDISRTEASDKQVILKLLYRLFHEKDCLGALLEATEDLDQKRRSDGGCNEFFHTWIVVNRYTQVVRRWFREVDEIEVSTFEPSELDWIRKAESSTKELLRPLALLCAHLWLVGTEPEDMHYSNNFLSKFKFRVWLLHGYVNMNDEGETPDYFSEFRLFETDIRCIPLEKMKELAEFGNLERTEHWHTSLGWIMLVGDYYESSTKHFRSALRLDPTLWIAMIGLGTCLFAQCIFEEGISWIDKAPGFTPPKLQSVSNAVCSYFTPWKMMLLNNFDGAIEDAKSKYMLDTDNTNSTRTYLHILAFGRRHQVIVDLIRDISQCESSNFMKMLPISSDLHDIIGIAAVMTGSKEVLEIMRDVMKDAVIAADMDTSGRWRGVLARIKSADFNYQYLDHIDVAMGLWEAALQIIASNFNDPLRYNSVSERNTCTVQLSKVYFGKAVEAKKAGEDYGPWIEKLRSLAKLTNPFKGNHDFAEIYEIGYPSQLYGIWLREYDHAEESTWKDCFRSSILQGIDLLSDEDPYNDWSGYASLALTLLHAGDIDGGTSALFITMKPLESFTLKSSQQQESSERKIKDPIKETVVSSVSSNSSKQELTTRVLPRVKLSNFDDRLWGCDGPCMKWSSKFQELHFCRICDETCFCEECIQLVRENKLPNRCCSPDHEWIQGYPIPKDTHDFAAATIKDGYIEVHQEWLNKLRKEWGK